MNTGSGMYSDPIASILAQQRIVFLDGALATELERRGCDLKDPLWSARVLLEAPELIRQVHLDYFRAGADCAITASYQATLAGLAKRGLERAAALELIASSVRLAAEARDAFWRENQDARRPKPFVAGSVGPYGAYLADGSEYRGDYGLSLEELVEFHRPRLAALVAAGAEILACETVPCLLEAQALVGLLAEFPGTRAWISFSAGDERSTCHGEDIAACGALLDGAGQVAAIGINCSAPRHIGGLVRRLRSVTAKPIVVYPNSGEVYDAATHAWHGETDCDAFGLQALAWLEAGARLIGGCCRTTPEHIRALVAAVGRD